MRLGICAGYEKAEIIKKSGFDYFEYNLVSIHSLSEEEMREARNLVERIDFYAEVMGIMLPPHLKIVGHRVNTNEILKYLNIALDRAAQLGCKMVTFGSSHSRNMPHDFANRSLAYSQIVTFLTIASELLDKRGMSLVIEPCPIHENNILTLIPEAYYVMRMVKRNNVNIMADTYTMQFAFERMGEIQTYQDAIRHLHFSSPNRRIPTPWDGYDYSEFFNLLNQIHYKKTLSIEAFHYDDFEECLEGAHQLLVNGLGNLIKDKGGVENA